MEAQPGPGLSASDTTGPKIIRPIPRRPFNLALKSPTPPEDDSNPATPAPQYQQHITAHDLRFLRPHQGNSNTNNDGSASSSLSRAASLMNLTSSTLFGIYSPTSPTPTDKRNPFDRVTERGYDDRDEPYTPTWGTGAETPARRRPGLDEETYKLMRNRSSGAASSSLAFKPQGGMGDGSSETKAGSSGAGASSSMGVASSLLIRGALLFALGMGYGVLVTRLPSSSRAHQQHQQHQQHRQQSTLEADLNWGYLTFWGGAGVALGCLLPWFDQVWEETFGKRKTKHQNQRTTTSTKKNKKGESPSSSQLSSPNPNTTDAEDDQSQPPPQTTAVSRPAETDWALVIRGIGAFVGIVFAIRRLPWASTMQVSLSLALTNPILWYLIDRSKPGFLLSAAVGVVGSLSVLVMGRAGFVGGVLPAPFSGGAAAFGGGGRVLGGNGNGTQGVQQVGGGGNGGGGGGNGGGGGGGEGGMADWFTSQENIEAGVWMLSVLFCSCVCFGNIGRRLALNRSAAARGRWGGVR